MEIITSEELESTVMPLLYSGMIIDYDLISGESNERVSQNFDYLKIICNTDEDSWTLTPMELQQAIVKAAIIMGDEYVYLKCTSVQLSFPPPSGKYPPGFPSELPTDFKLSLKELKSKSIEIVMYSADKISGYRVSMSDKLIYSSQGLWAISFQCDYEGTIGMTKDFAALVRSIYPQLDEELDRQLLNFIRWYKDDPRSPDEWEYIPGPTNISGWGRQLIEYVCKLELTTDDENPKNKNLDLVEFYRNIRV
jgi:hypothetical protein